MSTISNKLPIPSQKFFSSVAELAYGEADDTDVTNPKKIRTDLKAAGIDPEKALYALRERLRVFDGRQRLQTARAARIAAQNAEPVRSSSETRESLIEEIRKFLSLDGGSAVYANRWEESTVEDLTSLRNRLAETASRNSRRNASA